MAKTITHKKEVAYFGEEDLLKTSQNKSFASMIFELLSERVPAPEQSKLFELILNLSIDHGPETPSAFETIKAAQEGKTISEAVSAGVLQINNSHGGAIEPAMDLFYKIKQEKRNPKEVVSEYLVRGERMPGFGHRLYAVDPRSQLIFKLMKENGFPEEFIYLAKEIESYLIKTKGKSIPINIDGAIAVVLCTFGWESRLGKAVFIIARTPGLCGQFLNSEASISS